MQLPDCYDAIKSIDSAVCYCVHDILKRKLPSDPLFLSNPIIKNYSPDLNRRIVSVGLTSPN